MEKYFFLLTTFQAFRKWFRTPSCLSVFSLTRWIKLQNLWKCYNYFEFFKGKKRFFPKLKLISKLFFFLLCIAPLSCNVIRPIKMMVLSLTLTNVCDSRSLPAVSSEPEVSEDAWSSVSAGLAGVQIEDDSNSSRLLGNRKYYTQSQSQVGPLSLVEDHRGFALIGWNIFS